MIFLHVCKRPYLFCWESDDRDLHNSSKFSLLNKIVCRSKLYIMLQKVCFLALFKQAIILRGGFKKESTFRIMQPV